MPRVLFISTPFDLSFYCLKNLQCSASSRASKPLCKVPTIKSSSSSSNLFLPSTQIIHGKLRFLAWDPLCRITINDDFFFYFSIVVSPVTQHQFPFQAIFNHSFRFNPRNFLTPKSIELQSQPPASNQSF